MSAPKPHPIEQDTRPASGGPIVHQPAETSTARIDLAWRWVRYHGVELMCVVVPGIGAFVVTPWMATLSAVSALVWAVLEYRARHKHSKKGGAV